MPIRYSSSGGTPFGDTANRPSSPQVGQTYYNGQLGYLEIYTVSGWIPATGANDFSLNITGTNTTVTFSQTYSSGSYSIVSFLNDATLDIYAYATDGSLAGYTNTKAFTATQRFNKMVILGGSYGDVLQFSYKTTYATSASTTEVTAGPYITSITPSGMPNQNDTITITGGNFAVNVAVAFTGTGYSSTPAKSIVRSSATSLIVTRPDNFPVSAAPYTITVTNPSVANQPVGSTVHQYSPITAGVVPIWQSSSTLSNFSKNVSYSQSVNATDADGGSTITYSGVSGTLPPGITFNTSTGTFSGTPTSGSTLSYNYTVRATDSGGNYADRTFTMTNSSGSWITDTILSSAKNSPYSVQLNYSDDDTVTYSLVSGTIVPGLTVSSSGLVSGTPTASTTQNYSFTIRATELTGITSDKSFSIQFNYVTTVEALVVAGGGAGSGFGGGGGGAGGLYYNNSLELIRGTSYTLTVGGGGPQNGTSIGGSGINSTITGTSVSITALGGGPSGNDTGYAVSGGSGGGAGTLAVEPQTGGAATQPSSSSGGFGNAGGGTTTIQLGAGGGGAGAAGQDGQNGGAGGNGRQYSITGTATYYAGGGGGGARSSTSRGQTSGGLGGGGTGSSSSSNNGSAGSSNSGGGGGGTQGYPAGTSTPGNNGGSGVIIFRSPSAASATTGSPDTTGTGGGYYVYKFNNNGSITF